MSKLLLLVQTESDVQHLDAAAKSILNSAITGVWCVFSPAVTVNASEAATKLDGEIEQLKTAERAAADRSDYTAAAGYKTQREGKELDRAAALRDAWKTAPAEVKQTRIREIFGPFGDQLKAKGLAVRITGHSDHYDRDQWVAMLNSLSGVWFKEFTAGGFVIGWPEAVEGSIKTQFPERLGVTSVDQIPHQRIPTAEEQQKFREQAQAAQKPKTRREELEGTHHSSVKKLARGMGLDIDGLDTADVIEAILKHESKPVTEPALAEY